MKYQDLVDAWWKSHLDWLSYQESVLSIIDSIITDLRKSLEIPENAIFNMPIKRDIDDKNREYSMHGATEFHSDGWAVTGIAIVFRKSPNSEPSNYQIVELQIKRQQNQWKVRPFRDGPEFLLSQTPSVEELHGVTDLIARVLSSNFKSSIEDWLDGKAEKFIGFDKTGT